MTFVLKQKKKEMIKIYRAIKKIITIVFSLISNCKVENKIRKPLLVENKYPFEDPTCLVFNLKNKIK